MNYLIDITNPIYSNNYFSTSTSNLSYAKVSNEHSFIFFVYQQYLFLFLYKFIFNIYLFLF